MTARIKMEGSSFGLWTVLSFEGYNENKQTIYKCKCKCGTVKIVVAQSLRTGRSYSCGCHKGIAIAKARTTHGHSAGGIESRTYRIWKAMHNRVQSKSPRSFKYYMALGITVCKRWDKFENFLQDMGEAPPKRSIDRIDPYGNYEPGNCRWATASMQYWNQRNKVKRQ